MLQQRSLNILESIMGNPNLTINDLKLKYSLTKRQINYDLSRVNDWLELNGFLKIEKQGKENIEFKNSVNEVLKLLLKENVSYTLNEKERLIAIYLYLYISREEISLFHLTELLEVSRGTIHEDLKKLSQRLGKYSLKLSYSRIKGYSIIGKEEEIRYRAMLLIMRLISNHNSLYILNVILEETGTYLFNEINDVFVREFRKLNIQLSDNDRLEIMYITTFILMRGKEIKQELIKENSIKLEKYDEYLMANEVLTTIGYENKEYVDLLTSLLLSYSVGDYLDKTPDFQVLIKIIEKMIVKLEVSYGVKFNDKVKVLMQIYAHFRPAYYRILFQYPIINPLKNKIKKQYSALFNIIKEILGPLNLLSDIIVSDDEIAYLTIHFTTLIDLDVKPQKGKKIKAAIVCPNGTGISLLLYKELNEIFPEVDFLKPVPISELKYIVAEVDIVFSTKLIRVLKPLFIVSPIMSNLERANLIKNFYRKMGGTILNESFYVEDLLEVINKHAVVKDRSKLKEELSSLVSNYLYIDTERRQPMLSEIVTEELIQLNVIATDWKDAIRKSATTLVENNKVTENYVQAMIDSAEESGPYIVITKHVALPHARPEEGVKELAISVTTLKNPVKFGNDDNDPVKYVFCLSAIDNITHLNALSGLVALLAEPTFYGVLENSNDPKEIRTYIKKYEKEMDSL